MSNPRVPEENTGQSYQPNTGISGARFLQNEEPEMIEIDADEDETIQNSSNTKSRRTNTWSENDTFKLIEIWGQYENLCNPKNDLQMRKDTWITIENKLKEQGIKASTQQISKKISDLRGTFHQKQQKRLIEASKSTGLRENSAPAPTWKFYDRLNFLDDSSTVSKRKVIKEGENFISYIMPNHSSYRLQPREKTAKTSQNIIVSKTPVNPVKIRSRCPQSTMKTNAQNKITSESPKQSCVNTKPVGLQSMKKTAKTANNLERKIALNSPQQLRVQNTSIDFQPMINTGATNDQNPNKNLKNPISDAQQRRVQNASDDFQPVVSTTRTIDQQVSTSSEIQTQPDVTKQEEKHDELFLNLLRAQLSEIPECRDKDKLKIFLLESTMNTKEDVMKNAQLKPVQKDESPFTFQIHTVDDDKDKSVTSSF